MAPEYLPDEFERAERDDYAVDRANDWLELHGEPLVHPTLDEAIEQEGRARAAAARRGERPPWEIFADRDREGLWLVMFHERVCGSIMLDPVVPLRSVRVARIAAALNADEPAPPRAEVPGQLPMFEPDR